MTRCGAPPELVDALSSVDRTRVTAIRRSRRSCGFASFATDHADEYEQSSGFRSSVRHLTDTAAPDAAAVQKPRDALSCSTSGTHRRRHDDDDLGANASKPENAK